MYDHIHQQKVTESGDVTWDSGKPTDEEHAAFLKENAGETPDGQSEHKIHTSAQDATAAATGQGEVGPAAATPAAATTPAAPATVPAVPTQPATAPGSYTVSSGASPADLPTTDSLPVNPPNGARFSGSGTYQWYRQGNVTWRENTVNGRSCIAYATMEEWHKPIVSSHGCGRGA
jgi:hypothetical protein